MSRKIEFKNYNSFIDIKEQITQNSLVVMKDNRHGTITKKYPFLTTDGSYFKLSVNFGQYDNLVEFNDIDYILINNNKEFKRLEEKKNESESKALKEHNINDQPKPKFTLMPQHALLEVAKVFTFGESKYNAFNYSKGEDATVYIDAALRHINKYLMCKDIDSETNTHHLANAIADLLMSLDNIIIGKSNDNRNDEYKKISTGCCDDVNCKCR